MSQPWNRSMFEEITDAIKGIPKKVTLFVVLLPILALGMCSGHGRVDTGNVGLWNKFGRVSDQYVTEGLYFYNPFTTKLEQMSVQTTPWKAQTPVYTKDIQSANVAFNVSTSLNPAASPKMRRSIGLEWRDLILPQTVESTIKDVFGHYNAGDAIAMREAIQNQIKSQLSTTLIRRGIRVDDFQLTNIDYSDAFENAVEKAQVATQRANEAKNHTVEVEEQAKQTRIAAEAQAESIRVQASAITSNPAIIELKRVEKWDGRMPATVYCAASTPCVK